MSIIEDLKSREANDRSKARTNYRKLVQAVAKGDQPSATKAAEILSDAGHSADEFAQHVELARSANAKRERVASFRGDGSRDLRTQLVEAVEARQSFADEKARTIADLARREKEVDAAVSSLRRRIDGEARAANELAELERELSKQLGEAVAEPAAEVEPKASFTHTPAPEDAPDHRTHQPVLRPDGSVAWRPLPEA